MVALYKVSTEYSVNNLEFSLGHLLEHSDTFHVFECTLTVAGRQRSLRINCCAVRPEAFWPSSGRKQKI